MTEETEQKAGWTFATSEEHWSHFGGYATADDAASHAVIELGLQPGDTFYVGFAVPVNYADLADSICGETLVENLQEVAFEKWGYEEAFDEVKTPQGEDLEAMMRKAYTDWVAKHAFDPNYFTIEGVKKRTVPSPGQEN